jgi:predicted DNA-binding transcriptional regulator YafY
MPRGDQLSRQWQLLQLIDRPAGVTVDDAAAALGCTRRTIWRDLSVLQTAGFPIYDEKVPDGRRGLWRIREEFRRRLPLRLSLTELAALVMSRRLLAPGGVGIFGPAVNSAFERITDVLSRDAIALLDGMRDTIGIRALGAKLQLPAAEHVPVIQTALADRRTLRLRYYAMSRDEETVREVDPYHLTYFHGGLYLVGHCHRRRAPRIFAIERIRTIEMTRARFAIPCEFRLEDYLRDALGIIRGDVVTVKVVFSRDVARYVRERLWHPSQKFRDLPGGRLEITLRVADTLEVRRWVLGYGVQAEVIEPASLREALRAKAEALAARLGPGRPPLAAAPPSRESRFGRPRTAATDGR